MRPRALALLPFLLLSHAAQASDDVELIPIRISEGRAAFPADIYQGNKAEAAKAGGKVDRPKMSIGEYGFVSLVVDTEGNMIGLHSMK